MRARMFAVGVAALVAGVVMTALPASAADVGQTGPLSIHVVGTFGEPVASASRATVLPFHGQAILSGLLSTLYIVDGNVDVGNWTHLGTNLPNAPTVDLQFHVECSKVPGLDLTKCEISGAVNGRGALTSFDANPVRDGRIEFRIDVPSAFCPRCAPPS